MNDTPTPDKPDFRCIVSLPLFRRALSVASTDGCRYYISGVYIEPHKAGGALLVATNGSVLICLRDKDAVVEGGSGIIRLDRWTLKAAKHAVRHQPDPVLVVADGRAASTYRGYDGNRREDDELFGLPIRPDDTVAGYQWAGVVIDGVFPNWRPLIGEPDFGAPVGAFNHRLIEQLAHALVGPNECPFRLISTRNAKPPLETPSDRDAGDVVHIMFAGDPEDGFGIIMPVHYRTRRRAGLPSWLEA